MKWGVFSDQKEPLARKNEPKRGGGRGERMKNALVCSRCFRELSPNSIGFIEGFWTKWGRIRYFFVPPVFWVPQGVGRRTGYLGIPTHRVLSIFRVLGLLLLTLEFVAATKGRRNSKSNKYQYIIHFLVTLWVFNQFKSFWMFWKVQNFISSSKRGDSNLFRTI